MSIEIIDNPPAVVNGAPLLLPHHYDELVIRSGIDPAVIAARGYRSVTAEETAALGYAPTQRGAGLWMPTHTLAGVQVGGLLKRDEPRIGENGKPLKYEAAAGSVPLLDIHPDARHVLRDPSVMLYFTEGHKKADAAWSCGLPCIAITGVFMFLHRRLVVPDFDEIALEGRRVRVTFDSDVTRKPTVAEALLRFCAALARRGAKVEVVYLPEGPEGAKLGLDDFFVAGGAVADLSALARPWDGTGPGLWLRGATDVDPDELSATCTALVQAALNPENTRNDLTLMAATASLAMHKQSRGEIEPDGCVVLSPAEIADDWRPDPAPGERVAPVNPSGTKPRMARGTVKAAMAKAVESGRLRAAPREVTREHRNGTKYKDTEWVIEPAASFAAMIDPWARYRLTEPKTRKPRTVSPPCPHCGEVHLIRQKDYCGGCASLVAERVILPKIAPESAPDNFSGVENEERPASPPPSSTVRSFIGGDADGFAEPDELAAEAETGAPDNLSEPPTTSRPTPSAASPVDGLRAREREARRVAARGQRYDEAKRLLHAMQRRGIVPRRVGDGLVVRGEERLSERDQGLLAELETELCWWVDLEAAQNAAAASA